MVVLCAVLTGAILLLSGQVCRVGGGNVAVANIFFAMCFREGRIW